MTNRVRQSDPQLKIRMPEKLRTQVRDASDTGMRSMNAEIVLRLERSFQEKGPAEAATSPSHVTETPLKEKPMNGEEPSRIPAVEAILADDSFERLEDVIDMVGRAMDFTELVSLAVSGMSIDRPTNSVLAGLCDIDDILREVKEQLYAHAHDGGAA